MATGLKNITKMGTDVRKIAALLQKKAPPGHMLAYISGEEADLLRERGGSGKHMPDTGIPSFEVEEDTGFGETPAQTQPITSGGEETGFGTTTGPGVGGETLSPLPNVQTSTSPVTNVDVTSAGPAQDVGANVPSYTPTPTAPQYTATSADRAALLGDQGYGATPAQQAGVQVTPQEPKTDATGKPMFDNKTLAALGISTLGSLLTGRKAAQAGQAGAQQLQALATPYQQQGQQLQAQAQQGTLTPAGQQSLQALQAQVAQGVQSRGGVGVQQAAAAVEQLRQQLLSQQYQLGLQISGIGDNIAQGAIKTGMQADQYVNQLTSSYFSNIARIAGGVPTTTSITIPTGASA
jgi:hypothetical protein